MLQPVSEPVEPTETVVQAEAPPASQEGRERELRGSNRLWRWISAREVVFIFLACSVGAALFRTRDSLRFDLAWQEDLDIKLYKNSMFPFGDEKLPSPLVTDIDSDGLADMLILTYDNQLKLYTFPDTRNPLKPQTHLHTLTGKATVNIWDLSHSRPIAMATGFLRPYQSMIQVRQQVVVVLTSDWTVLCLDHELKMLWKSNPTESNNVMVDGFLTTCCREATILVSPVSIQKGDMGSVIVGGRVFNKHRPEESFKRMRRGEKPDNEKKMLDSLDHYTTFALEGRGGAVRWHHGPGDFEINPAYSPGISPFTHLKLMIHRQMGHDGEVSWHQFSTAIRSTLPHSWQQGRDTHFGLAHFKKDRKKSEEPGVTNHISKVSDMAMGHIAGLAFGGLQPHSPSEHVEDPNVLVIHSVKGLDILHLYQGRPLCSLHLSPYHTAHADIDGDGTIDHVHAVVNPGEAGFSEEVREDSDCYGQAVPMTPGAKPLFRHSICKATHWTETFIATDKWLPALNKVGRKRVNDAITEPLAPVLIESSYHNVPFKLHLSGRPLLQELFGGRGGSRARAPASPLHQGPLYDSVFVLSSGRVTSIGPQGEFNWQVDTKADWDQASEVIYNQGHHSWQKEPEHIIFVHGGFTPTARALSLQAFGKKDHILVSGWKWMALLGSEEGSVMAGIPLLCQPVAPPVVADFTNDGWNDIIVVCAGHYMGYTLNRQSGFWHSTVLGLFVGMVIVVIAIYTRQKSITLLPALKTAQD